MLEVNRYYSDPRPNLIKRILGIQDVGVDEWIGMVAAEKDLLNTEMRGVVKNTKTKTATYHGFLDELEKIARSPLKDFLAGVDPSGSKTFQYGMADAGNDNRFRRAIGTTGGILGGATVVPAAVSSVIGGARAAKGGPRAALMGALKGAYSPFSTLYLGLKSSKGLDKLQRGVAMHPSEKSSILKLIKVEAPKAEGYAKALLGDQAAMREVSQSLKGGATDIVGAAAEQASAASATKVPGFVQRTIDKTLGRGRDAAQSQIKNFEATPAALEAERVKLLNSARDKGLLESARGIAKGKATQAIAGLGLSGGIGGGSAWLQYGKGRETGKIMTPEQRAKATA
jgi:predicted DNA-binding WGR domain protein